MSDSDGEWDEGTPERLYVIAGGRVDSNERADVDLVTLIVARQGPQVGMQPELASILRVCRSPLSVAEISAYLVLPPSLISVLLTGLLADGRVEARTPDPSLPDIALIEAVIHGLQKL